MQKQIRWANTRRNTEETSAFVDSYQGQERKYKLADHVRTLQGWRNDCANFVQEIGRTMGGHTDEAEKIRGSPDVTRQMVH